MKSVVERKNSMVEPIDFNRPVYSAVNINIRKPEVDANKNVSNPMTVNNDNGIYNAVKIDIDNPKINTDTKPVYDYPEAEGIVTYDMLTLNPIALPEKEEEIEEADIETEDVEAAEVRSYPW